MARVLYVSQYFVSGDQPGGVRHWQHTRALARAGHDVTVVTSYVQHKERTIPEEYRGKRIVRSHEDGLEVIRTYATPGYGRDMKSRMSNYATFAAWSVLAELRIPRPDVVVAVGNHRAHSSTKMKTLDPEWNETFVFSAADLAVGCAVMHVAGSRAACRWQGLLHCRAC